jgi:hypothetical protein
MHQFAWLERFEGTWLLLNHNEKYPARTWMDKNAAIAELSEEGWTIKPLRKRALLKDSGKKICGYAMMRKIH